MKQTSERVSDTVFFNTKFITQPTLTPADMITKALNDLTQALKGKRNHKGLEQLDALKRLETILNNVPDPEPTLEERATPVQRRVTFNKATTKPPENEAPPTTTTPQPRVIAPAQRTRPEPIHKVAIEKAIRKVPPPRVQKAKDNLKSNGNRDRIRQYIETKTRARIPQRTTYIGRSTRSLERAQTIYDEETNTYLNYRQLMRHPKYKKIWATSSANEFGRRAYGTKDGRVKGTQTIRFIQNEDVPGDRRKDVTYGSFSCDLKPNKAEKERTRLTMGGDRINYPDNCGTPTADMILFKILVNNILSTPKAKCLMLDIKDFYLRTPMKRPEYMCLKITDIPEEITEHYNLRELVTEDRYAYCEITRGMYGLPQAGIIAQELLEKRLGEHRYYQSKIVHGLWKHKRKNSSNTCFFRKLDCTASWVIDVIWQQHLEESKVPNLNFCRFLFTEQHLIFY